jgi:hypothetical protein
VTKNEIGKPCGTWERLRNAWKISLGKPEKKKYLVRPVHRLKSSTGGSHFMPGVNF